MTLILVGVCLALVKEMSSLPTHLFALSFEEIIIYLLSLPTVRS
jgi:hypothetical protein